jgi:hypothetical protein
MADLRYPSLGLGLDGGLASSLRRVIGGGVTIGDDAWDKRHYLTGREASQVESFATTLKSALLPLRVADVEDERLTVERRDAGQNRAPLRRFGEDALALARTLPKAVDRIPPPSSMASARPAWEQLARRLDGELRCGDMAIFGRFEGAAVAVATVWGPKGEPEHTSFEYRGDDLLSEKDAFTWADGRLIRGDLQGLSRRARTLVNRVTKGAKSIAVATDRIVLWDDRAPILSSDPLVERLAQLAELAAALRGRGGPYR